MFTKRIGPNLNRILTTKIFETSNKFGNQYVTPKDLIYSCLHDKRSEFREKSKHLKVNVKELLNELINDNDINVGYEYSIDMGNRISKSTEHIIKLAIDISEKMNCSKTEVEHIVLAFLSYRGNSGIVHKVKNSLMKYGFDRREVFKLSSEKGEDIMGEDDKKTSEEQNEKYSSNSKDAKMELSLVGVGFIENVNESVKKNPESFVGRERELDRCVQVLCRKKKRNLAIIGEGGTGKTFLINGIAQKIIEKKVPKKLQNATIYTINLSNIIAGTKYRGQFEERMKKVLEFFDIKKTKTNSIVFIDEMHVLVGAGKAEGAVDAIAMLKPKLSNGELQCIGATTPSEYRKFLSKDTAFARRFSTVFLEESSKEETLEIIRGIKHEYEKFHNIIIKDNVSKTIVDLADQYVKNRFFPDKAIDILDEACSTHIIEKEKKNNYKNKKQQLSIETILSVVSEISKVPITRLSLDEKNKLKNIREKISLKVIGQDHAVSRVCTSIQLSRAGLKDPNKPIGVFMFLGMTGTGKTLLAKTLSEEVFGTDKIIRLDMSEYMESHSVSKIIGAPPGYVGYDESSFLIQKVSQNPYSVILLDEIEKANNRVLNVFLQIFDEGRLTDSTGAYVDFRNTIIIMTSNISANKVGKQNNIGFYQDTDDSKQNNIDKFLKEEVNKYFSPEFINRIDETLVFNKLTESHIKDIMEKEIKEVKERIKYKGYSIVFSSSSKNFILKKGYDDFLGARPMKRVIRKFVEEPFAEKIFQEQISSQDIVYLGWDKEKDSLNFNIRRKAGKSNGSTSI